jgi:alkylhydroperoxidase family enzyme
MSRQRIAPVTPPFAEEVQKSFDIIMPDGKAPINIFKTMARNPRVLSRMLKGGLLDRDSTSIAERELVILRVCGICQAEYEWGVHVEIFSGKAELTQPQIKDTYAEAMDPSLWSKPQQFLIQMVDELHNDATISAELWRLLIDIYEEEQLVELVMLAGLYHAVSFVVNAFHVEKEVHAPRFSNH